MIKITNERPKWLTNNFIKWFAIGVGVTLVTGYIICEALSLGNVPYLVKWQQCGSRPVSASWGGLALWGERRYVIITTKPGWFDDKTGMTSLYCSVDEAKAANEDNADFEVK